MIKVFKKILTVLFIMFLASCYSTGERYKIDTDSINNFLTNTYWKGDSMSISFTSDKYGIVEESLKKIDVNSFKISYILGYDNKVAMLCENYDKIKIGINIEDGKFISEEKLSIVFNFLLTNHEKVDTIKYREIFIKQ